MYYYSLVKRPAIFFKVAPDIRQWIPSSISKEHVLNNLRERAESIVPARKNFFIFIFGKLLQPANAEFNLLFVGFQFSIRVAHFIFLSVIVDRMLHCYPVPRLGRACRLCQFL